MKRATLRAVCLSCVVATPLWAQDNPKPEVDLKVMVLMNGFYTSGKTNNVDLPQVAVPPSAGDSFPTDGLGATIRQSRVTAHAFLAGVAGGDFNAELDVDFWGGQQPSNGGRTFPLLRIRRAWAQMTWDWFNVLVGQEAPPIVELNPSSLASIGLSSLSASGNLWLWIPQIRLTGDLLTSDKGRLSLEATVLAPTGYEAQGPFLTQPDEAEASKRPYLQSRILYRWGEGITVDRSASAVTSAGSRRREIRCWIRKRRHSCSKPRSVAWWRSGARPSSARRSRDSAAARSGRTLA